MGAAKPHVAPFLAAAAAAGCHPSQIVHVGDSIESDLVGALAVGMRALLLTRPELPARTALELASAPPADALAWREVTSLEAAADLILGDAGLRGRLPERAGTDLA